VRNIAYIRNMNEKTALDLLRTEFQHISGLAFVDWHADPAHESYDALLRAGGNLFVVEYKAAANAAQISSAPTIAAIASKPTALGAHFICSDDKQRLRKSTRGVPTVSYECCVICSLTASTMNAPGYSTSRCDSFRLDSQSLCIVTACASDSFPGLV